RLTTSRYHPRHHSHLPSFPTRRSSDLNGTRKGGQPDAMKILYTAPGMEDLWQMHFSLLSGQEYTVPGVFIANPIDDQPAVLPVADRKSTRLNSSHQIISYAVFCLNKET